MCLDKFHLGTFSCHSLIMFILYHDYVILSSRTEVLVIDFPKLLDSAQLYWCHTPTLNAYANASLCKRLIHLATMDVSISKIVWRKVTHVIGWLMSKNKEAIIHNGITIYFIEPFVHPP